MNSILLDLNKVNRTYSLTQGFVSDSFSYKDNMSLLKEMMKIIIALVRVQLVLSNHNPKIIKEIKMS